MPAITALSLFQALQLVRATATLEELEALQAEELAGRNRCAVRAALTDRLEQVGDAE